MDAQSTFDFCPTTVGKVAKEPKYADFKTPPCCERQAVVNFDHNIYHNDGTSDPRVNRVCIRCGAHWYGPPSEVKQYKSKEWDSLQDAALEEDKAAASGKGAAA